MKDVVAWGEHVVLQGAVNGRIADRAPGDSRREGGQKRVLVGSRPLQLFHVVCKIADRTAHGAPNLGKLPWLLGGLLGCAFVRATSR